MPPRPFQRRSTSLFFGLAAVLCGASGAGAQAVLLQIKPQVGDTIFMILDQQSRITGTRHTASGTTTQSMGNTMRMFSRAIVEGSSARGTTILAVTDSVQFESADEGAQAFNAELQRMLRGQRTRFIVAPDGSVGMADRATSATREMAEMVAMMPAALPRGPVTVGESWVREMTVPAAQQLGTPVAGVLRATFRFDSLTNSGRMAYISMRGELVANEAPAAQPGRELATLERGSVRGAMFVDRERGWVTESRFTIVIHSKLIPPASTGVTQMMFQTDINQRMRALSRH